jgi:hypothetical protein
MTEKTERKEAINDISQVDMTKFVYELHFLILQKSKHFPYSFKQRQSYKIF